jgi:choline-sulfatase
MDDVLPWTDGESLVPLANGSRRESPVRMEYAAEGTVAPMVCTRSGPYKYVACEADPPQLFDLASDPNELVNLMETEPDSAAARMFTEDAERHWNLPRFDAEVRESQARRWVVYEALRNGAYYPWDFQPLRDASERFMRNHMDLNTVEENQRFPRGE